MSYTVCTFPFFSVRKLINKEQLQCENKLIESYLSLSELKSNEGERQQKTKIQFKLFQASC